MFFIIFDIGLLKTCWDVLYICIKNWNRLYRRVVAQENTHMCSCKKLVIDSWLSFCSWSQASCSKSWNLPFRISKDFNPSLMGHYCERLRVRIHSTFPIIFSSSKDSKSVFFLPRFSASGNEMGNKEGSFQIVSKEPEVGASLEIASYSPRWPDFKGPAFAVQPLLGLLVDLRLSTRTSTKHELPSKLDSRVPDRFFSSLHFLAYSTTKKEEKLVSFLLKDGRAMRAMPKRLSWWYLGFLESFSTEYTLWQMSNFCPKSSILRKVSIAAWNSNILNLSQCLIRIEFSRTKNQFLTQCVKLSKDDAFVKNKVLP